MLAYSRHEKHGKPETRILGVIAGDEFGFGFGEIERQAIGFRDRGREIAEKAQNLRQRGTEQIPARQESPAEAVLGSHDVATD